MTPSKPNTIVRKFHEGTPSTRCFWHRHKDILFPPLSSSTCTNEQLFEQQHRRIVETYRPLAPENIGPDSQCKALDLCVTTLWHTTHSLVRAFHACLCACKTRNVLHILCTFCPSHSGQVTKIKIRRQDLEDDTKGQKVLSAWVAFQGITAVCLRMLRRRCVWSTREAFLSLNKIFWSWPPACEVQESNLAETYAQLWLPVYTVPSRLRFAQFFWPFFSHIFSAIRCGSQCFDQRNSRKWKSARFSHKTKNKHDAVRSSDGGRGRGGVPSWGGRVWPGGGPQPRGRQTRRCVLGGARGGGPPRQQRRHVHDSCGRPFLPRGPKIRTNIIRISMRWRFSGPVLPWKWDGNRDAQIKCKLLVFIFQ